MSDSRRKMSDLMPKKATWIEDEAISFHPKKREVITKKEVVS